MASQEKRRYVHFHRNRDTTAYFDLTALRRLGSLASGPTCMKGSIPTVKGVAI